MYIAIIISKRAIKQSIHSHNKTCNRRHHIHSINCLSMAPSSPSTMRIRQSHHGTYERAITTHWIIEELIVNYNETVEKTEIITATYYDHCLLPEKQSTNKAIKKPRQFLIRMYRTWLDSVGSYWQNKHSKKEIEIQKHQKNDNSIREANEETKHKIH